MRITCAQVGSASPARCAQVPSGLPPISVPFAEDTKLSKSI
jgi:hypothetical protein